MRVGLGGCFGLYRLFKVVNLLRCSGPMPIRRLVLLEIGDERGGGIKSRDATAEGSRDCM